MRRNMHFTAHLVAMFMLLTLVTITASATSARDFSLASRQTVAAISPSSHSQIQTCDWGSVAQRQVPDGILSRSSRTVADGGGRIPTPPSPNMDGGGRIPTGLTQPTIADGGGRIPTKIPMPNLDGGGRIPVPSLS